MNLKLLITASIIITVLAFTACNKNTTKSTHEQTQIIDTEEDFSAGFDPSAILSGDLWFTAADTGLKVTIATQEILNQYENYITYIDESAPIEYKIIFTSTNAIDLEFLAIRMEYDEAKGEFFLVEDASMASSIVRPDTPFVVNLFDPGLMPHRAVAFYDRNDVKRYFTISGNESGEGAPILLTERQAASQPQQTVNADFLSGQWEDEEKREYVHIFSMNHNYRWGLKETSNGENGRWELNGNTLTLTHTDDGWEDYAAPRIEKVQIVINNDNNIVFIYPDGKRLSLIRNH